MIKTLLRVSFVVIALGYFIGMTCAHGVTADLGWLSAMGHWINEQHRLPTTDPFSWVFPHKAFVAYQWGFESILARAYSLLKAVIPDPWRLLIALFMGGSLILYGVLPVLWHHKHQKTTWLAMVVACLGLIALTANWSLRPMAITSLFLMLQFFIINRAFTMKRAVILLLTYSVWANCHTGFMIGLLAFALQLLGDILHKKPCVFYGYTFVLCILATGLNPYGFSLYPYLYHLSHDVLLNQTIEELQPPHWNWWAYQSFGALLFIQIYAWIRYRPQHWGLVLLVSIFSGLTFFVQRFVVWAVLYLVLSIPLSFPNAQEKPSNPSWLKIAGGVLLVFLILWPFFPITHGRCHRLQKDLHLIKEWIPANENVLTDPDVGSCLLLEVSPLNFKIGMDTRFDYYGGVYLQTLRDKNRLAAFLSMHDSPPWLWMQRSWIPTHLKGYRLAWQGQYTQLWQKNRVVRPDFRNAVAGSIHASLLDLPYRDHDSGRSARRERPP
jgi:hypothetical protein